MQQALALERYAALDAEYSSVNWDKIAVWLHSKGLSVEMTELLLGLLEHTEKVGSKVINVGKIIVGKIVEFIHKYPATSASILAVLALNTLIASVPLLGPALSTIVTAFALPAALLFGTQIDGKSVVELAKDFFCINGRNI
ncbi:hypothetical protein BKN38_07250 [Helicobacter sp. CLO-3]|uniref:hypothetical protein n=1 Tax=unclassified Helicobacter TaxID=2593540 RepID=UPI000805352C|nr:MULTISPECIES: hypothetical protein [unclassified Helicobacter]OBV29404.1 hypothetical protein BA723_05640 [Helicobacter sp. CLO-3]OHU82329.1 hypothetical protein BKN38_07250 [Helicobacter sp. CLO-3]